MGTRFEVTDDGEEEAVGVVSRDRMEYAELVDVSITVKAC